MKKVLVINHYQKACGVQSFGLRVWNLVKDSKSVDYYYREVEDVKTFYRYATEIAPDVILFNWHRGTMPWLTEEIVSSLGSKSYFMFHDEVTRKHYDKYLFFGDYDFTKGEKFGDKKILLPRPLLKYDGGYKENDALTIGSFGFGFWNKGYHTLTNLINTEFPWSVVNFHMPYSYFGDPQKKQTKQVEAECRKLATKIELHITHDLLDDNGVLEFLAGNDINIFLYEENGEGISSVLDYALSVKRPIAISDSRMFRHISNNDILISKNSIESILAKGTKPLEKYYTMWNIENFKEEMDNIFNGNE
jgi:hypothetical protein